MSFDILNSAGDFGDGLTNWLTGINNNVSGINDLVANIKGIGKQPETKIIVEQKQTASPVSYDSNIGWKDYFAKPNSTLTIVAVGALVLAGFVWVVDLLRGKK